MSEQQSTRSRLSAGRAGPTLSGHDLPSCCSLSSWARRRMTARPPPPPSLSRPLPWPTSAPTAWSCTADTLRSGKECVFEAELTPAESNKEQASSNVRTIQEHGPDAVRGGREVPRRARASRIATSPPRARRSTPPPRSGAAWSGTVSIVDSKGRFAPAARACYRAISAVLQETQMSVTVGKTASARSQVRAPAEPWRGISLAHGKEDSPMHRDTLMPSKQPVLPLGLDPPLRARDDGLRDVPRRRRRTSRTRPRPRASSATELPPDPFNRPDVRRPVPEPRRVRAAGPAVPACSPAMMRGRR